MSRKPLKSVELKVISLLAIKKELIKKNLTPPPTIRHKRVVAFKITLFLFSSNHRSPYKSKFSLTLTDIESKLSQMDFTLFIRTTMV